MNPEVASARAAPEKVNTAAADEVSWKLKTVLDDLRAAQAQVGMQTENLHCLVKQVETSVSDFIALQSEVERKGNMLSTPEGKLGPAKVTFSQELESRLDALQRQALADMGMYKARFAEMERRLCDGIHKLATAKFPNQARWAQPQRREGETEGQAEEVVMTV
ncbi:unnamed protein product, partial [Sphacelaria rigidula]